VRSIRTGSTRFFKNLGASNFDTGKYLAGDLVERLAADF
jgi:hypothetical protein